ncbi:MAG: ferrous iron transport protein A [Thermodesulfovibrionales bacterium]
MLPLGLLISGEQAEILEIKNWKRAYSPDLKREKADDEQGRIEDMGIRVGKSVQMLNNRGCGPLLLKVDESRIAMGRGMAMKIMVRRKE